MKVIFLKPYKVRFAKWTPGSVADFDKWRADEVIAKGIAKEYTGQWPPNIKRKEHKMKFNLKDLK
jgi:hypothetical protein